MAVLSQTWWDHYQLPCECTESSPSIMKRQHLAFGLKALKLDKDSGTLICPSNGEHCWMSGFFSEDSLSWRSNQWNVTKTWLIHSLGLISMVIYDVRSAFQWITIYADHACDFSILQLLYSKWSRTVCSKMNVRIFLLSAFKITTGKYFCPQMAWRPEFPPYGLFFYDGWFSARRKIHSQILLDQHTTKALK